MHSLYLEKQTYQDVVKHDIICLVKRRLQFSILFVTYLILVWYYETLKIIF